MYRKEVNAQSPLRILEASIQVKREGIEAGIALLPATISSNVQSISFTTNYEAPIVISSAASSLDAEAGVPRIKDVGSTSFDVAYDEWDYLDKVHAFENVDFLIAESGRVIQPDGSIVEAGSFELDGAGQCGFPQ